MALKNGSPMISSEQSSDQEQLVTVSAATLDKMIQSKVDERLQKEMARRGNYQNVDPSITDFKQEIKRWSERRAKEPGTWTNEAQLYSAVNMFIRMKFGYRSVRELSPQDLPKARQLFNDIKTMVKRGAKYEI